MLHAHSSGTFAWPVRVYYEDTDAAGVVYYANYLRFLERARTEWLRGLGFEIVALERDYHSVFVVRHLAIDYRAPAKLGEALAVTVALQARGHSRLRLRQSVLRDAATLCAAEVTLACLHPQTWRPVAMPDAVARKLKELA